MINEKVINRFMKKISVDDCGHWKFNGRSFRINGKDLDSNRASYVLFKKQPEKGQVVKRSCESSCCVNPDHLYEISMLGALYKSERSAPFRLGLRIHCKNGHEFNNENILPIHGKPNARRCRKCTEQSYINRRDKILKNKKEYYKKKKNKC